MKAPWMLALAFLVSAAPPCLAESAVQPQRPGLSAAYFKKAVGLDTSQMEKMQMLLFDYDKATTKKSGELQFQELEFLELLNKDAADLDKVEAKFKEVSSIRADLESFRVTKLLEARQFLKDSQYAKYRKIVLQMYFQEISAS